MVFRRVKSQISSLLKDYPDRKSVDLESANGYQRKLTYELLKTDGHRNIVTEKTDDPRVMRLTVMNKEDILKRLAEQEQAENEELDQAVGFSKVGSIFRPPAVSLFPLFYF